MRRDRGFTIIELLVATMVFAVVLLVVSSGILQITRVYYKGVTESNTQNTARSIMDVISQSIQFGGGDVIGTASAPAPSTDYAFCVGNQQFSYRLGWQSEDKAEDIPNNQLRHVLVQRSASDCNPQDLSSQSIVGRDLVGTHMRLANLVVQNVGPNLYRVQVRVVYGDNDLLFNPTATNASCKGQQAGTQFCATAELSTIVVKRVE